MKRGDSQTFSWGPTPVLYAIGLVVMAGSATWALLTPTSVDRVVAGFFAVLAAVGTGIAFMMRERLTAGPAGLVVAGVFGRTIIAWSQIVRLEAVARTRLGLASTALEIDLDDDGLLLFGKTDLGADPEEVARQLRQIRSAHR